MLAPFLSSTVFIYFFVLYFGIVGWGLRTDRTCLAHSSGLALPTFFKNNILVTDCDKNVTECDKNVTECDKNVTDCDKNVTDCDYDLGRMHEFYLGY